MLNSCKDENMLGLVWLLVLPTYLIEPELLKGELDTNSDLT